ncbi:hypothetical protein AMTR_s00024p00212400 [Amborella trichopoda]|uniref:Pectinesterase n=1 Tax=Amborella trichopoda TaxID=13333 RepID=W1PV98_AMBTC|nr:hypothetical protein AMTR_s00024p00212400 [Amborella trichopoda]
MGTVRFICYFVLLVLPLGTLSISSAIDERLRRAELNHTTITVGQDGSANFPSIMAAIGSIPKENQGRDGLCMVTRVITLPSMD